MADLKFGHYTVEEQAGLTQDKKPPLHGRVRNLVGPFGGTQGRKDCYNREQMAGLREAR